MAMSVSSEDDSEPVSNVSSLPDRQTLSLSLRATYTKWNPREAFREIVQNWRDGIIASFALAEEDLSVEREVKIVDGTTEVIYKVPRPNSEPKEWLGFIHFKPHGQGGIVEITNRNATLQPWHLDMGGTSKTGNGSQAGAHGEGLKVALLVLMRGNQNHKVRCRSGGFNWTFNFTKRGRLVARLYRMSDDAISKVEAQARSQAGKTLLPFCPRVKKDLQIILGEPHNGRSDWGVPTKRSVVSRENFEAWTASALFLQDPKPDELIRTSSGDLLIDQRFRRRLYLKGLLLNEDTSDRWASVTNKPLKFGYNFSAGTTNRERQSVAGAYEESATILDIWAEALVVKPGLVGEFSHMLNTRQPEYADVSGVGRNIGRKTAQMLRNHLTGEPSQRKWYYSPEERTNCSRLDNILQGLGYDGCELSQPYWDLLHEYDLIHSAQEEERERFRLANPIQTLSSDFSIRINTLLQAAVRACPLTNGTAIQFVEAGTLGLQTLYTHTERLLMIHERFVSFEGAVEELGLPDGVEMSDVVFHTVNKLFTDALEQLPRYLFQSERGNKSTEWHVRLHMRLAEQRLLNFFRLDAFQILTSSENSLMTAEWSETKAWPPDTTIEIQYHDLSRCAVGRQGNLEVAEDVLSSKMPCLLTGDPPAPGVVAARAGPASERTCLVARFSFSDYKYCEMTLEEAREYMVLAIIPSEPSSFVSKRFVPPLGGRSSSHFTARDDQMGSREVQRYFGPIETDETITDRESLYSEVDCADATPVLPQQTQARTLSINEAQVSIYEDSANFTLGEALEELDIFSIRDWYEAVSGGGHRAVIGLLAAREKNGFARKRQRMAGYTATEIN